MQLLFITIVHGHTATVVGFAAFVAIAIAALGKLKHLPDIIEFITALLNKIIQITVTAEFVAHALLFVA